MLVALCTNAYVVPSMLKRVIPKPIVLTASISVQIS